MELSRTGVTLDQKVKTSSQCPVYRIPGTAKGMASALSGHRFGDAPLEEADQPPQVFGIELSREPLDEIV